MPARSTSVQPSREHGVLVQRDAQAVADEVRVELGAELARVRRCLAVDLLGGDARDDVVEQPALDLDDVRPGLLLPLGGIADDCHPGVVGVVALEHADHVDGDGVARP